MKPDEDPDGFFQHLDELLEIFEEIREGISDGRPMDILIVKPIPEKKIVQFHYARDTDSSGLYNAELAIHQTWMRTIQPQQPRPDQPEHRVWQHYQKEGSVGRVNEHSTTKANPEGSNTSSKGN